MSDAPRNPSPTGGGEMLNDQAILDALLDAVMARADPAVAEAIPLAAAPHWFDAAVLAALRERDEGNQEILAALQQLTFVAPYGDASADTYAYHDSVRAALLARLHADPARFRELSCRAWRYFAEGQGSEGAEEQAEALYHHLACQPSPGFYAWRLAFHDAERYARYSECDRLLSLAQEQAHCLDDAQRRWLRYYQGRLDRGLNRWAEAEALLRPMLAETQDPTLRAWTLDELANALQLAGRWAAALEAYQESLDTKRELGDTLGAARTLGNMGIVYEAQGRWAAALDCYQQDLDTCRELGDRLGAARTLGNMGLVYGHQGRWAAALAAYQESLDTKREFGDTLGAGQTLLNVGRLYAQQGQLNKAIATWQEALAILKPLGVPEARDVEGMLMVAGLPGCGWLFFRFNRWLRFLLQPFAGYLAGVRARAVSPNSASDT